MGGFKPQILDNLNQLSDRISSQNVDFILIKLNLEDQQTYKQFLYISRMIAIPIIIISEGRSDSFNSELWQYPVTVLHHTEAIALLIPTLRNYLINKLGKLK